MVSQCDRRWIGCHKKILPADSFLFVRYCQTLGNSIFCPNIFTRSNISSTVNTILVLIAERWKLYVRPYTLVNCTWIHSNVIRASLILSLLRSLKFIPFGMEAIVPIVILTWLYVPYSLGRQHFSQQINWIYKRP